MRARRRRPHRHETSNRFRGRSPRVPAKGRSLRSKSRRPCQRCSRGCGRCFDLPRSVREVDRSGCESVRRCLSCAGFAGPSPGCRRSFPARNGIVRKRKRLNRRAPVACPARESSRQLNRARTSKRSGLLPTRHWPGRQRLPIRSRSARTASAGPAFQSAQTSARCATRRRFDSAPSRARLPTPRWPAASD